MLFCRFMLSITLLSILLVISKFFGFSGLALAQSLLSDRVWLEKNINILIEKDLSEQDNYSKSTGTILSPLNPHQSFSRHFALEKPELKKFSANLNTIEFITIATTGNAIDFGDMTAIKAYTAAASSHTRAVNIGGFTHPASTLNVIEYVEIATTGNAVDWGDIDTGNRSSAASASNAHGGL